MPQWALVRLVSMGERMDAYLASLPAGLESHPECRIKGLRREMTVEQVREVPVVTEVSAFINDEQGCLRVATKTLRQHRPGQAAVSRKQCRRSTCRASSRRVRAPRRRVRASIVLPIPLGPTKTL